MLEHLNLLERQTQDDIIRLLQDKLGYEYYGNLEYEDIESMLRQRGIKIKGFKNPEVHNSNIIAHRLAGYLQDTCHWSEKQANEAVRKLRRTADECHTWNKLYDTNEKVYNMLLYGTSVAPEQGKYERTVRFIDWDNWKNNSFAVAEEVSLLREGSKKEHRRPDIVIYVNGIAVAVLELKRAAVSVADGIRQNYRNQQDGEIPWFFSTVQLVMAGNPSEGLHYGTVKTPEKFFLRWKEPAGITEDGMEQTPFSNDLYPNELYRSVLQMLDPKRLLEFIHDCVIFDAGVKKVARPNQYFALKAAQPRILTKDSGIIWHSQGSGKSLTMVWLAKWIHANVNDSRIVVITDRDELDKQITANFVNVGENDVCQAKSGKDLVQMLNRNNPWLITTLVHKFGSGARNGRDARPGEITMEMFLDEVRRNLPADFSAKGDIYVFVDECHRTQGGKFNRAMKEILGQNVMFVGFTGTPLLKKDKNILTSKDNFGRYIHSYRFDEAVADGVVLDLRYEARYIDQSLADPDALNQIFEHQTRNLSQRARLALQDRWAKLQYVYSSTERMQRIVGDILKDMMLLPALSEGYGNAMLVAEDIYAALKYWHLFNQQNFGQHCAVVCSYNDRLDLDEGYSGEQKTREEEKQIYYHEMLGGQDYDSFETEVKERFIKQPADMKLLIVVNKLLTGFDAPSATYLYIDKALYDHNLFQAICRVNRVNGDQKEFGYIVDYKQLFPQIEDAIQDYTNGAFAEYDKADVSGLLKNRLAEAKNELDGALAAVNKIVKKEVNAPYELTDFLDAFCVHHTIPAEEREAEVIKNAVKREQFYQAVMLLSRRYSVIAMQMDDAGYTEMESRNIAHEVKMYDELRHAVMRCSGDYVDMKMYDAQMRALLDRYIVASRCEKLESLDDFSFLDIIDINPDTGEIIGVDKEAEKQLGGERGVSELMVSNVRRVINRKRESNPAEYKLFSDKLNRLLEDLHQKKIDYISFLKGIKDLSGEIRSKDTDPWHGTDKLAKAFYDNFGHDKELSEYLSGIADDYAQPGFSTNPMKKKLLERKIRQTLMNKPWKVEDVIAVINAHVK